VRPRRRDLALLCGPSTSPLDAMRPSFCSVGIPALLVFVGATGALAQLAPDAPKDQPGALTQQQLENFEKAIGSRLAAARDSYPAARSRFLKGLPAGQHFFVVTRLHDPAGRQEQVFVRVQTIRDGQITGWLSSQVTLVSNFSAGQLYTFKEADLIDWVITKPDGSEEGNVVGKFLDAYRR